MSTIHGEKVFTSSGVLISSGKPVRVWNLSLVGSGTAAVQLYGGTSASGTARISLPAAAANRTTTQNFEGGLLFSSGCYVELESTVSQAILECRLET